MSTELKVMLKAITASILLYALVFFTAAMCMGCGEANVVKVDVHEKDPREGGIVEEEFLPFVEVFEDHWGRAIYDIPITFKKLPDPAAGVCRIYRSYNGPREIQIDPDFWKTSAEWQKEAVILHELGHCVLQRGHLDIMIKGHANSLMHSYVAVRTTAQNYYNNRKAYLDELFTVGLNFIHDNYIQQP